jgi:hypothetical protein
VRGIEHLETHTLRCPLDESGYGTAAEIIGPALQDFDQLLAIDPAREYHQ